MILLFASYQSGEHYNTILDSVDDAISIIEEYIKMEELEDEVQKIGVFIKERLQNYDDVHVPLSDGTWYTITNSDVPIYSIVSSTQDPCEADVVRSFVSLKNAKKALKEAKENGEEMCHEEEDYFIANNEKVCYQIQKNWIGGLE